MRMALILVSGASRRISRRRSSTAQMLQPVRSAGGLAKTGEAMRGLMAKKYINKWKIKWKEE
jgi:hypothetical protein